MLIILSGMLFFTHPPTAYSLDPKKTFSQYVHDLWTTDNGLPQNSVESIVQSPDGYLWFATQEGLVRFDGLKFTVFDRTTSPELPSNNIFKLHASRDGKIWMLQQGAIALSVFHNGTIKPITTKDGLAHNEVSAWLEDNEGNMWFSTNGGLSKLSHGTFKNYTARDGLLSDTVGQLFQEKSGALWISTIHGLNRLSNGKIDSYLQKDGTVGQSVFFNDGSIFNDYPFAEDHGGNIWIGSAKGLHKISNGNITTYRAKDGLSDDGVSTVAVDHSGTIWVGIRKGVSQFKNGKFITYKIPNDTTDMFARRILEDKEGVLWMIASNKGLLRLNNGRIEQYTTSLGLSDNDVRSIFEDNEGSLWIGTYGTGLNRLRDGKFITLSSQNGLSYDLVNPIYEDNKENLWIGTAGEGLNKYANGTFSIFTRKEGLLSNRINSMCQDNDGNIWVGTDNGLNIIENNTVKKNMANLAFPGIRIPCITKGSKGEIWISIGNGIACFRNGILTKYDNEPMLKDKYVFCIVEDRNGTIWLGTNRRIIKFSNGKFSEYTLPEKFSRSTVFGIYEDNEGVLWLSTAGTGIVRFKNDQFVAITPQNGLFDYNSYVILEDDFGNFWTDCNKGIYRVSKQELNDFADGKIQSVSCTAYGTADGMRNRECNGGTQPAGWKTKDGRLCFPTVKGVAIINPADVKLNTVPPFVTLEQMKVDNEILNTGEKIELSPGKEKFEFHYAGISFVGPEKVVYKYKLEGFDKDWVSAENRREAYYTNIPHGEYTFKVLARNNDGVWNEAGASVAFILKPFFYQTGWFYALCVFGFVGVGPSIYFYRIKQLKQQQLQLESVVQARTKDLQQQKDKTESAYKLTEQARHKAEEALKELKDTQNQLVLSEKMASLGQLTAGIAHEIKNPLNFVNNFAVLSTDLTRELREEVDKQRTKLDPNNAAAIDDLLNDLEQNVTKINQHGKRADSIVKGMLLHSRGKSGERLQTDINALLAEYVNLAYHGLRAQDQSFNIKIESEYDPTIEKMMVVPQNISRAILNIVNNGCYAANEKKKTKGDGFSPTIKVSSKNLGNSIEIRIRDNGNGIPQKVLDKIFNPFFTTKPAGVGTGLGLSMTYDIIVQEHKGDLKINTKEGEFAEFVITLPKHIN